MVSENSETLVYRLFSNTSFLDFTSNLQTLEQRGVPQLILKLFNVFYAFSPAWR